MRRGTEQSGDPSRWSVPDERSLELVGGFECVGDPVQGLRDVFLGFYLALFVALKLGFYGIDRVLQFERSAGLLGATRTGRFRHLSGVIPVVSTLVAGRFNHGLTSVAGSKNVLQTRHDQFETYRLGQRSAADRTELTGGER